MPTMPATPAKREPRCVKPLGDDLDAVGIRSYVSESNRGCRDWEGAGGARARVCQSPTDTWPARPSPDVPTRRADRTLLRAPCMTREACVAPVDAATRTS